MLFGGWNGGYGFPTVVRTQVELFLVIIDPAYKTNISFIGSNDTMLFLPYVSQSHPDRLQVRG